MELAHIQNSYCQLLGRHKARVRPARHYFAEQATLMRLLIHRAL